ncbi:MAG: 6-phosphogluconolactonase [Planctomycetaceae bacterium TMED10]|nr:MAG: 6-phosphogluconolactonase [Planctomycetaceae bacterium TMED10]
MGNPQFLVDQSASGLCEKAASMWRERSEQSIAERGRFNVVLAGGSTPRELYQILASRGFRQQIEWSKTEFFFGDERSVAPDHPDSNFRMVREALFEKIALADEQIHRMHAEDDDLDGAAMAYQELIAGRFGIDPAGSPPAFDLILLGMGTDAHTASLFPHTSALNEERRWVVANDVPELNTRRMTMTVPVINAAHAVAFLIAGESKTEPVFEVLCGAKNPEQFPSQQIAPSDGSLMYFLDQVAAAKLPESILG